MSAQRTRIGLLTGALFVVAQAAVSVALGQPVDFNRDVRPILSENCYFCHGPDDRQRQAGLRLDRADDAYGWAIEPGHAEDSLLVERITSDDPDQRMPPLHSEKQLTSEQIELLKRWIDQGANYQPHWSFLPPQKPEMDGDGPAIDQFVGVRLQEKGLDFAEPATKQTWIRRVTFDLTGLPPTLDEVDAFLADSSDQAFEKVVDRLLASPHYGQRMATDWLDVARYSDTYGYQVDRDRRVWPWRDWVIRAFNDNLPYDQFLIEQVAGDLLPDATRSQILATTFNRLHPQKVEGGSVPEEFRIEYVADRTQTFGTAFLGLTLECCRCHHHKFDPISQEEFFRFTAYFDNIDEAGLYSFFTNSVPTPTLALPSEKQAADLQKQREAVRRAEKQLRKVSRQQQSSFEAWWSEPANRRLPDALPGQVAHLEFESGVKGPNQAVPGRIGKAVRLTGDDAVPLEVGNFRRYDPFSVALWMKTPDRKSRAVVFHRSKAWTDAGSRGYQLLIQDGKLQFSLVHFMPGNAITVETADELPVDRWQHVAVTWDGSSRAGGVNLYLNGRKAPTKVVRDKLQKTITGGGGDHLTIGQRFRDNGFTDGEVDEFRVFDRELTELEVATLSSTSDDEIRETTEFPRRQWREYYLHVINQPYGEQREKLRNARREFCETQNAFAEIMVMQELPQPRTTYVLRRGRYDSPGDPVTPSTPDIFSDVVEPPPSNGNRLDLARWATNPDHPLTARVAVNRLWQMCFGHGLVRTPEDFGNQGQPPTHPQLLDWLAVDFVESGWDVKRMLRQVVLSRTYRQSSKPRVDGSGQLIDPDNRWLSRGPSYRWPAEMLRDRVLADSGLLVDKLGGPPVKPYEVAESFKPTKPDSGEGLYRRSLYTYWKRTGPAPVMMTLDAAKRDVCRMRRERTDSPLASLVLMNGPQFVEAAQALGDRLIKQHEARSDVILKKMFRLATGRRPVPEELNVIENLFRQQRAYFQKHGERRDSYLSVGQYEADPESDASQLAALAVVANMLWNLDESINKR